MRPWTGAPDLHTGLWTGKKGGWVRIKEGDADEKEYMKNLEAVQVLADNGDRVMLVKRSSAIGKKSADAIIDGEKWEIKTSQTGTYRSISGNLGKAGNQADRIILVIPDGTNLETLNRASRGKVKQKKTIKEIIVIQNNAILWRKNREELLK